MENVKHLMTTAEMVLEQLEKELLFHKNNFNTCDNFDVKAKIYTYMEDLELRIASTKRDIARWKGMLGAS